MILLNIYTQLVTTSNYSVITDSHTLQFTTARTNSSQSDVFTSRCLVTSSNGRRSPFLSVPELSLCLSYQLLTAADHNYQTAAVLWWLTNSLHSTVLNCTNSNSPAYNIYVRIAEKTPFLLYPLLRSRSSARTVKKTPVLYWFIGRCLLTAVA
jgi:hypothetical protein